MILHNTTMVLIEKDGKFLLAKRGKRPSRGYWCIPGGHVDAGESIYDCAVREAKEEIGDVKIAKKPVYVFVHDIWVGHRHRAHLFLGKVAGKIRAGSDAAKIGWFTLEEMKEMDLTNYTLKTINKLYSKKV